MISSTISSIGIIPGQNITPDTFTPLQIQEAQALAIAYLSDWFPTQDFQRGSTLHSLLVRPMAMWYLVGRFEWETLRATQSLGALLKNPNLVIDEVVDAILSNFRISRRSGTFATGRVRVDFSATTVQSIPTSLVFSTVDGIAFSPSDTYRITDDPQDDNDLRLFGNDSDAFYALIPVTAVVVGVGSQIRNGTPLSVSPGIPLFVVGSAFGDFQGGANSETNEDLVARLPSAMTVKNLASPLSIKSTILDNFTGICDVSVQGAFDKAMTRNSHGLLGIKSGGFADIYVRAAGGVLRGIQAVQATLQQIVSGGGRSRGIYSASLQRGMFPGHYFVTAVRGANDASGSYFIRQEVKDLDLSSGADASLVSGNVIPEMSEGFYSRYQTNTVFFEVEYDSSLGTTVTDQLIDEVPVSVEVLYTPFVNDIQNFVLLRNSGVILADYLVKAVIPCMVRLPIITVDAIDDTVLQVVKDTILSYINSLTIGETLRCDGLVVAIREVSGVTNVRLPIRLEGEVFPPSGPTINIVSNGDLELPSLLLSGVVPGNSAFFIEPSDINISIITS
jgi:hypothetical protein